MKTMKHKLTLHRETLRSLSPREIGTVAGGWSTSCPAMCGPTEVNSCTSCVCSVDPVTCG